MPSITFNSTIQQAKTGQHTALIPKYIAQLLDFRRGDKLVWTVTFDGKLVVEHKKEKNQLS